MQYPLFVPLVLVAAACGGQVTAPKSSGDPTPAAATCEVLETYTEATGAAPRIPKYTSDGRLLSAQTRLTADGHGLEHVAWKNDRIARIDSTYETPSRQGNCDVEGGCDEPAVRTVGTSLYRYDATGRWTGLDHETVEYRRRGDALGQAPRR